MGYRNSTPTNVMLAETKVMSLKNRTIVLAKKFLLNVWQHGPQSLKNSLEELQKAEAFTRYRKPTYEKSVISLAWEDIKRYTLIKQKGLPTIENELQNTHLRYQGRHEVWEEIHRLLAKKYNKKDINEFSGRRSKQKT